MHARVFFPNQASVLCPLNGTTFRDESTPLFQRNGRKRGRRGESISRPRSGPVTVDTRVQTISRSSGHDAAALRCSGDDARFSARGWPLRLRDASCTDARILFRTVVHNGRLIAVVSLQWSALDEAPFLERDPFQMVQRVSSLRGTLRVGIESICKRRLDWYQAN